MTRFSRQENMTQDLGFNLKWTPSDNLTALFDLHYIDSTVEHYDMEAGFSTYANATLDVTARPKVTLREPTNVNIIAGQASGPFANPNSYRMTYLMDHLEDSEGDELAAKADFEFHIDSGLIDSVKIGARVADRQQVVRWSKYNWSNIANTWEENQRDYYNLDRHDPSGSFNGYPQGFYEAREFSSGYHDLLDATGGGNKFQFFNMDWLKDQSQMAKFGADNLGLVGKSEWDPICSNKGKRIDEVAGSCYRPSEIVDVSEETQAAYIQVNYGGDQAQLFGFPVSGNLGVRVVKTDNESAGSEDLPGISALDSGCRTETRNLPVDANGDNIPDDTNGDGIPDLQSVTFRSFGCVLSADQKAFLNATTPDVGTTNPNTATASHTNVLPSFNLKVDLNDEWLARLALSRAMARPDIGYMKNYVSVGAKFPNTINEPGWIRDPVTGEVTGVEMRLAGSSQNPFLKPIEANQIDIAVEHYWSDVGSLTGTVFYKQFDNYIQSGSYEREFTSNGVTQVAQMTGPINGDGASIKGFEIAYQTFFDMLPAPFDGLGVQVNYTRIYNDGINNSNTNNLDNGDKDSTTTGSGGRQSDLISVDRLEGLSDHGANLVGMYEKGDWAFRLAYNWRSEYLVTAVDCCTLRPVWTEDTGQVDGSIKYNFNDNIAITFSGSNLLNEETVTTMQVTNDTDGGKRVPYGFIQNDRRFTLGVKLEY
jgi:TonB-dependent receptor